LVLLRFCPTRSIW
jgi:hypothetical protein